MMKGGGHGPLILAELGSALHLPQVEEVEELVTTRHNRAVQESKPEEVDPPLPLPQPGSKAWTGTKEHNRLSFELAAAHGPAFQRLALPLLRVIWPQAHDALTTAVDGGHLSTAGDSQNRLVVLFLGFGQDEISAAEAQTTTEAVERFRLTELKAHSYLVVHNRDGRSAEFRETVQAKLADLVHCGRVKHAELWDRQRLLQEAFHAMLRLTLTRVRQKNLSVASLEALYEHPSFALGVVPLKSSTLVIDQYQLKATSAHRPRLADAGAVILDRGDTNLAVLIGEFGSGKTTAVGRTLARETLQPIYVPGAAISDQVHSTKDLLEQCIDREELFAGFQDEDRNVLERLARPVVEYAFKDAELPVVLILDGLDESAFLTHRGGFQHLFNSLREVRIPVVVTMRSEFWIRGERDFAAVFGETATQGPKRYRRLRLIELLPWTVDQILTLIRRHRDVTTRRSSRTRLDALAMLVETGRFHTLYGDLPQRPLFLRLIVESVMDQGLPGERVSRARLLHDWAELKILRDVNEPIHAGGTGRMPILSDFESSETTVELAWEAMMAAAGAMVVEYEGELELTADCELETALLSSPRLAALTEPQGLFLNSLLLPVPQPRGTPLRIRFAHRTFQEFFLARYLLQRPAAHAGLRLPASVVAWIEDIESEQLLWGGTPAEVIVTPKAPSVSAAEAERRVSRTPPDLEIRVTLNKTGGETRLSYYLRSADGRAGFRDLQILGEPLRRRPEEYHDALFQKLESLHAGARGDGTKILGKEIEEDLVALGCSLYQELFPPELRAAYRTFRKKVRTLLVVSDEPWIPWEIVRPYDDEDPQDPVDDLFLCEQFRLTRWLARADFPSDTITVERLACFEAGETDDATPLPFAVEELQWIQALASRHPGIDDRSLPRATFAAVKARLKEGGLDLLHFVGHGRFDPVDPDESGFHLVDGRPLRPLDLHREIRRQIKLRRPLVFLNACQAGRPRYSLTGLGGWAPRFVEDCGCGAFVAPLWTVNDRLAHVFATTFYEALEKCQTFGEAARLARLRVQELDPASPTRLAFTVYAHPNARLILGRPGATDATDAPEERVP